MKAIILVAGIGKRLQHTIGDRPKSLLKFGGISLLERHLNLLRRFQVDEITLVVGYQADKIEAEIARLPDFSGVKMIHNLHYAQGSVVSLQKANAILRSGDDILLMDGDVLYESWMLERLINTSIPNCFLLDGEFEPGDEPVKLCVKDGLLVEFRKQLEPSLVYDRWGESVGFFRFAPAMAEQLAQRTDFYVNHERENEPHEEAIRDLLLASPTEFGYEDVSGGAWIEIDFPEDIEKAKTQILPRLQS